ncbi:MAG: HAD-IA family hydrolase [Myxococcales bacterium]
MARYDAVLFDLLTALLDSWSLWNAVAGSSERGLAWRKAFLRRVYATGAYQPYDEVIGGSARDVGLPDAFAQELLARWDELQPYPEVGEVLAALGREVPLGVVTNCSEALGARALSRTGVRFTAAVTAERASVYKPDPRIYQRALAELGVPAERALFVAGSSGDVPGAAGAGMKVFWHNRMGLALPSGAPPPLRTADSLRPLLAEVLGP